MNLRQIEVFRAVMVTGSITAAADLLHVSQPGISRMIRHIEIGLGVPLFARAKRRLLPTPEARSLQAEIDKVYRGVKSIQDFASGLKKGGTSVLRVATSPSTGLELVPEAMSTLAQRHPGAKLSLEIVPVAEMTQLLLAEQVDAGISTLHIDHPLLDLAKLGEWRLVCVFPTTHPLQAKRRLTVRDVLRHRLVSFHAETAQGRIIDNWFASLGCARNVSVEVRSGQVACALVANGAGVAFVDDLTARAWSATLVARELPQAPVFPIMAVTSRARPASVLARQLFAEVEAAFRSPRKPVSTSAKLA
jgi:DNA-binding transcriptional LysR family regulator